jgi:hypothetical protein
MTVQFKGIGLPFKGQLTQVPAPGTRIYYTGDVCNQPDWGVVVDRDLPNAATQFHVLFERIGDMTLQITSVGDVYEGHCHPRFVTGEAYDARRAARAGKVAA